jgi:putative heme-binding domain-containing protein
VPDKLASRALTAPDSRPPRATFFRKTLLAAAVLFVGTLGVRATQALAPAGAQPAAQKVSKAWTMDDLLPAVIDLGTGHDWAQGRALFKRVACGVCHAFGSESEGNGLAPDLTAVGSKYTRDFILQSILEPSATLNGQYFHTTFTLKNGDLVTGSVIDVVDKKIIVAPAMLAPQVTVQIAEADVKSEAPAAVSPMPAGLLNELTKEQIVELMAFLDSGGDRPAAVYKKN